MRMHALLLSLLLVRWKSNGHWSSPLAIVVTGLLGLGLQQL